IPMPGGRALAICSISRMASPELWSAAGSPRRETDGEPLKRSSFGEPSVHCVVEKAENGTMPPCALRTYQRFTSSGSMRKGASPWTKTFFTRPLSIEVVDIGGAQDGAHRGVDDGQRKAQRACFFLVDIDLIHWHVVEAVGSH